MPVGVYALGALAASVSKGWRRAPRGRNGAAPGSETCGCASELDSSGHAKQQDEPELPVRREDSRRREPTGHSLLPGGPIESEHAGQVPTSLEEAVYLVPGGRRPGLLVPATEQRSPEPSGDLVLCRSHPSGG